MIDEIDTGWNDVLRRARRPRRRVAVLAAIGAAALVAGGSAAGVLLTQDANALRLPIDQIGGNTIVYVVDAKTHRTLLEVGRWKRHNGICFLVPRVRAGCLRHGQRTPLLFQPPFLLRGKVARRFRLMRDQRFLIVAREHGAVELVDAKGRVLERVSVGR